MTISSENNANRYTADGTQTQFTGTFKIYDQTHVKVLVDDSVQTLGTDYTVSGVGQESGFTVTFTTAPAANSTVTLLLAPPSTQLTDYTSNDPFPAETHERALDLLTQQVLALKEKLGRLLGFSEKSTYKDITVDDPVAGRFLRWKSDLSGLENIDIAQQGSLAVSDYMKTVLDDQDAATARGTLGAAKKVSGATNGNLAAFDASGDLADSGKSPTDFLASSEKGSANGVATLDANGKVVQALASGYALKQIVRYTSGSGTYTPSSGVRRLLVRLVGGGAGGTSGVSGTSDGGGGGAGAYCEALISETGYSFSYAVGAGGTAGSNGGDTTFSNTGSGGTVSMTAGGGKAATTASGGGLGGTASGGDLNVSGGPGQPAPQGPNAVAGGGGSSIFGGGGRGGIPGDSPTDGFSFGAGGGGGSNSGSQAGGAGAGGLVEIWEFV